MKECTGCGALWSESLLHGPEETCDICGGELVEHALTATE